ncbi:hypothetical protein GCM10009108_26940 [Castellaniella ginsengisoli]|uniref:Uncharacterized protein n=1 Tax=Castellaniella ginsengisoli TaxID=546114 RepID=A0ABN1L1W7_9BURK
MNRRHFIAATGATLLTILAGCKTEPDGEKFVGYWLTDLGRYPPTLIHIKRNGDSLLFTVNGWNNIGKVGYRVHTVPATPGAADNILVVAGTKHIAYDEASDQITTDGTTAKRITQAEYEAELTKKRG